MSRPPDYRLKAMDKRLDLKSGPIGAAWMNDNGSISVKLDWPITLTASPDLILTLFPVDDKDDKF